MAGLFLALMVASTPPNPFLAEARVLFQAQDYAKCLKRVDQAGVWKSTLLETAELELVRGLCLFGRGEEAQARAAFEKALRRSPEVVVPPWTSPRIRQVYEEVRAGLGLAPWSDAPVRTAEPAPQTTPTAPTLAPPSMPPLEVAAPPPARLGLAPPLLAGAVAVLATGVGIGLGTHARTLESRSYMATYEQDARAAALGSRDFAIAANVTYGVAGAAALAAGVLVLVDAVRAR